ncbi:MAG: hypothetical protein ABFS23_10415 [Pseudomonadota bacterium]
MLSPHWLKQQIAQRNQRIAYQSRLHAAVEEVVDSVDPRLRSLPGYRRKLAPAIHTAAEYSQELIDQLPEPILATPRTWAMSPYLRAFFASVESMRALFDNCRMLANFLGSPAALGTTTLYAGVGMRLDERVAMGHALHGDRVQSDVMQTTVSFGDHRIGVVAANKEAFALQVQRRVLEELAARALQKVMDLRSRKDAMEEEQVKQRWKLKIYTLRANGMGTFQHDSEQYERHIRDMQERLQVTETVLGDLLATAGTIDDFLDVTVEVFSRPRDHIGCDSITLYLDKMNVKCDRLAAGASKLELTGMRLGHSLSRIVQPVCFAPDFVRKDSMSGLRMAERILGL